MKKFDKKLYLTRISKYTTEGKNNHQARNLINLYSMNLSKLIAVEEQFIFQSLIFEKSFLKKALKVPGFSKVLAKFATKGYQFAKDSENIQLALFFLRMGAYFSDFAKSSEGFPDVLKETDLLLKLSHLNREDQGLILRERLAYQGRSKMPLTLESCKRILEDFTQFQDKEITADQIDYKLDHNIQQLGFILRQFLAGKPTEEIDWVTSKIFNGKNAQLVLPYIFSIDEDYRFDLLAGQLFFKEMPRIPLPQSLKDYSYFEYLFMPEGKVNITNLAGNSHEVTFEDLLGNSYKAVEKIAGTWEITKICSDGKRYTCIGLSREKKVPKILNSSLWQDEEGNAILIDRTTNKINYTYVHGHLYCDVKGDPREKLYLVFSDNYDCWSATIMIAEKKARHPKCFCLTNKEHTVCRANGSLNIRLGYTCNLSKKENHKKLQPHKLPLVNDLEAILKSAHLRQLEGQSVGKQGKILSKMFGRMNLFLFLKNNLNWRLERFLSIYKGSMKVNIQIVY